MFSFKQVDILVKSFGHFSPTLRFGEFRLIRGGGRLFGANLRLRLRPMRQTPTFWPSVLLPKCIGPLADNLFSLFRHSSTDSLSGTIIEPNWLFLADRAASCQQICAISILHKENFCSFRSQKITAGRIDSRYVSRRILPDRAVG